MKFYIINREPIVAQIPNLSALINFLAEFGHDVIILTSENKEFPRPKFESHHIRILSTKERSSKAGAPTLAKIFLGCLYLFVKSVLLNEKAVFIYSGHGAIIISNLFSFFFRKKTILFIVEYPDAIDYKSNKFSSLMELSGIKKSRFYITHDHLHAKLINRLIDDEHHQYRCIPNGTRGDSILRTSDFLHKRLNIEREKKIILHSGGFGKWFSSSLLSAKSANLPNNFQMVFHCSHDISNDFYFLEYQQKKSSSDSSIISMKPVGANDLDNLVSSAYIGIAWYDLTILGARAGNMGLAAGKIGNYLKCGIPVIAPKFESLRYIEEYACGVLIDDLTELNDAIFKIDSIYSTYRANAISCYNEIWNPENLLKSLETELSS